MHNSAFIVPRYVNQMSLYFGFKAENSLREIVAAKPLVVILELQDLRIFGAIQWSCEAEGDNSGKDDEKLHVEMFKRCSRMCWLKVENETSEVES